MKLQSLSAVLGIWLMTSPGVLGYDEPGNNVVWIAGPIVASISFIAAFPIGRPLRWLNVPIGIAVVFVTSLLDVPTAALVNAILAGLAVVALALVTPKAEDRYAGGWASLFGP